MGISLSQTLNAMLYMVLCGVFCGILYDGIRILRVLFHVAHYSQAGRKFSEIRFPLIGAAHRRVQTKFSTHRAEFWLFAGDILFAVCAACSFSITLAVFGSGIFRWFYLLCAGIGFFAYYFTCGKFVMLASEWIAGVMHTIVRYGIWLLCAPFRLFGKIAVILARVIHRRIGLPVRRTVQHFIGQRYTRKMQQNLFAVVQISEERSDEICTTGRKM